MPEQAPRAAEKQPAPPVSSRPALHLGAGSTAAGGATFATQW